MTALDAQDYDVLNVVALKKMADAASVSSAGGLPAEEVSRRLDALAEAGHVVVAGGSALPTDSAEPALAEAAATRYASARADDEVLAAAERFESVNAQFLKAMSAWQQMEVGGRTVANDHSDADYDEKVVARLDKLVTRLDPLIDALAAHDARFTAYRRRFAAALERVDRGEKDLVSSPMADSVHNIWFEFHEDLLRTLGRERTE